jgi:hypothetical protein
MRQCRLAANLETEHVPVVEKVANGAARTNALTQAVWCAHDIEQGNFIAQLNQEVVEASKREKSST